MAKDAKDAAPAGRKAAREARLAEQLRANLRRRKEQARERGGEDAPSEDGKAGG